MDSVLMSMWSLCSGARTANGCDVVEWQLSLTGREQLIG